MSVFVKPNVVKPNVVESNIRKPSALDQSRAGNMPASEVWLLAASTGGLQAVAQFLARVNPGSRLGFIYVQHIEVEHEYQLVKLVERHSQWRAEIARAGSYIAEGCVTVISPGQKVSIGSDRRITHSNQAWSNRYRPCIDDICSELSASYRQFSGMIVFTGMGDDGVMGSKMIKASGGQVWVQAPETCTVAALPEAIQARGEYDFCADIEGLTDKINGRRDRWLNRHLDRQGIGVPGE